MKSLTRNISCYVFVLCLSLTGMQTATAAEPGGEDPSAGAMALDLFIARPFHFVTTVVGTSVFVVALPFSAMGGNVGDSFDALVKEPAQATFFRCLGCVQTNAEKRGRVRDDD